MLELPLSNESGAGEAADPGSVGEDTDGVGPALDLLVQPLERVGAVRLDAELGGEGQVARTSCSLSCNDDTSLGQRAGADRRYVAAA